MKHFDIIILGAGASGCMCALSAAKSNKNILIIDKLAKAGKKLLATGNGRCNLSNEKMETKYFNQNINKFLSRFDTRKTLNFFQNLGLMTFADEEGRIYPLSNSAKSVVDVINNEFEKHKNITLSLENKIEKIQKTDNIFLVKTTKGDFSCNKLVVAIGGKSAEEIVDNFKLEQKPFSPSLVALKTQNTRILEGVKISNVKVTAKCENKSFCEDGEILFKDCGLSGIVTFNASTIYARQNNYKGEIDIDLFPQLNHESLINILKERRKLNLKIKNFFDGMFVSQIGFYILNSTKIQNEERLSTTLTDKEIENFAKCIKCLQFKVKGCYDNHQVLSGGIKIEDLTDNLESKHIKNLYFCGEVCDVDGFCGGYNLQWAWTSGRIVGESIC